MRTRTQTVNRLHVLLTQLLPGGAPRQLTADTAAGLLRPVRPRAAGQVTARRLPADLIAEIRRLDRCVTAVTAEISAEVAASATTLTSLRRTGDPGPEILARVGDVTRFLSAPTFASYTGPPTKSPPETSYGTGCLGPPIGNRTVACTPWPSAKADATAPARTATCANKHGEGRQRIPTVSEARTVRRGLPTTGTRPPQPVGVGSGRTDRGSSVVSAAGLTPTTASPKKALPGPVKPDPYRYRPRSTLLETRLS